MAAWGVVGGIRQDGFVKAILAAAGRKSLPEAGGG